MRNSILSTLPGKLGGEFSLLDWFNTLNSSDIYFIAIGGWGSGGGIVPGIS